MEEKTLRTGRGVIHYWRSENLKEDADTLFFLHGLTADHTMFAAQASDFEAGCNILAWDAPAHGKSRPFEPFSFPEAAGWIRDILDECGIAQAVFVGQSLGGYFTQSFIMRYPDRIRGFVSIGSTPYGRVYYSRSDIWIIRQVEWMAMCCPFGWMKHAMARQVSTTQAAHENMLQMLSPYSKKELCRLMGIGYAGFLEDNCDLDTPCPVQLILGEEDRIGKVKQYNLEWARRTGYPLEIIPGAAHNANVDRPQAVNACIRRFLSSLQP